MNNSEIIDPVIDDPIKYEPDLIYDDDDDQNNFIDLNRTNPDTLIEEDENENLNEIDGHDLNDDDIDDSTSRLKREILRGQNYHYQRGYELSRLRYENRLRSDPTAAKPKAFFIREYHQGRNVPIELLRLTQ
ncbi:hypothetical protein BLA29_012139, partial [Euroglyphus maynei]